ncbi:FtsX-like permease family protein [Fusibacter sp. JL298sf-3]
MRNFFYTRLAVGNLVKNRKLYAPYCVTNVGIITMFYIMLSIGLNKGFNEMPYAQSTVAMLFFGTVIIGIFSTILVFYTNSFLLKQRQKEIGLYNILGMEKRHIAKMLGIETGVSSLACLVLGLLSGMVLSKLMFLILLKLMHFSVPIAFSVSFKAMTITSVFFGILFACTLLYNVARIHLLNPINLMRGSVVGEKEPKSKWLMALIGAGCLGYGYYLAQSVDNPMMAIQTFFIAVLFVIVATYTLFTAGSIVVLKGLRKNKKFYYNPKHFIAVSGMIYRMKQNASGLASICVLSCAVLVSVSTTVSMYIGIDDMFETRYPMTVEMTIRDEAPLEALQTLEGVVARLAETHGVSVKSPIAYGNAAVFTDIAQSQWTFEGDYSKMHNVYLVLAEEMSRIQGERISVSEGELLAIGEAAEGIPEQVTVGSTTFKVEKAPEAAFEIDKFYRDEMGKYAILVFGNETNRQAFLDAAARGEAASRYTYAFDLEGDEAAQAAFSSALKAYSYAEDSPEVFVESRESVKEEFVGIYGGFLFLGIFLGTLFLMATAMIIYYKQISEGYDDKGRFEILQKVGMSHSEIKKSINRQIVMVFFLPLVAAIVHITFAFNVIKHLLTVFNMVNTQLFIMCTVGTVAAFAVIYYLVYMLTARAYYRLLVVK